MTKSVNVFVLYQLLGKVSIHIFLWNLTNLTGSFKQNQKNKTHNHMLEGNSRRRCFHLSLFALCFFFIIIIFSRHVKTVSHIFILHVGVKCFNVGRRSLSCARLSHSEWDDGGGEEAGAPEGAGQ